MLARCSELKVAVREWFHAQLPLTRLSSETDTCSLLSTHGWIENDEMSTHEELVLSIHAFNHLVDCLEESRTIAQAMLRVTLEPAPDVGDRDIPRTLDAIAHGIAKFHLPVMSLVRWKAYRYLQVCEHYSHKLPTKRYLPAAHPDTETYYCEMRDAEMLQHDIGARRYVLFRFAIPEPALPDSVVLPSDLSRLNVIA